MDLGFPLLWETKELLMGLLRYIIDSARSLVILGK
jgi:hypothetical protein